MATTERIEFADVEGLRVGRFSMGVSTAAIVYRMGRTLIDTGPPNQWARIRVFLDEKPISRVLISHHHEDHSGNGTRIQRERNVPVLAPAKALGAIANGFPLHPYQRIFWGTPLRFEAQPLPGAVDLEDGRRLEVLETPGHCDDMVCFLEPERGWLFSGDLFVGTKLRYLRADENLHQLIATLRSLVRRDFDTLFCAHRGVVTDGRRALEEKIAYLEDLRGQARGLRAKGMGISCITRQLLGKEDLTNWITWNHYSKRNLIASCLVEED